MSDQGQINGDSPAVILGLWPIAGITSVGVEDRHSVATIRAALEEGVRSFDTAYSYGYHGRSDRVLAEALHGVPRDSVSLISKVGQFWNGDKQRVCDNDPKLLRQHFEELLTRLKTEYVDLLMLHQIDPTADLKRTAAFFAEMQEAGKARQIGICNANREQLELFHSAAGCAATQFGFNMLQQEASEAIRDYCAAEGICGQAYWVLMKGILAGKIGRDHPFAEGDSRPGYAIYQGEARAATHDLVDQLRRIADDEGMTTAQLVVAWTLRQRGIGSVLLGAKRAEQIRETARATRIKLSDDAMQRIDKLDRPAL